MRGLLLLLMLWLLLLWLLWLLWLLLQGVCSITDRDVVFRLKQTRTFWQNN